MWHTVCAFGLWTLFASTIKHIAPWKIVPESRAIWKYMRGDQFEFRIQYNLENVYQRGENLISEEPLWKKSSKFLRKRWHERRACVLNPRLYLSASKKVLSGKHWDIIQDSGHNPAAHVLDSFSTNSYFVSREKTIFTFPSKGTVLHYLNLTWIV